MRPKDALSSLVAYAVATGVPMRDPVLLDARDIVDGDIICDERDLRAMRCLIDLLLARRFGA